MSRAAELYTAEMRKCLDGFQQATRVYSERTAVYRSDPRYEGNSDVADLAARDDRARAVSIADADWHKSNAVMWALAALVEYCREGS